VDGDTTIASWENVKENKRINDESIFFIDIVPLVLK